MAPLQPQQQLNDPGSGGRGRGRWWRVSGGPGWCCGTRWCSQEGFASGSTINQKQTSASAAAHLSDATLDAGAARAFGFLPNMTSAFGLGSTNPPHGSLSASTTSASGLGPNNPLHGSLSASTIFASSPGINTLLPNAVDPSPAACPYMQK